MNDYLWQLSEFIYSVNNKKLNEDTTKLITQRIYKLPLDQQFKNFLRLEKIKMNGPISWNPDTDGRPEERYRWYKNHKIGTFSDEGASKWKYYIDGNESEDWFPERVDAEQAIFSYLDEHEHYKSGYST